MKTRFRVALGLLLAGFVVLVVPVAHAKDRAAAWFKEETETLSNATVAERQAEFFAIGNMLVANGAISGAIRARAGVPRWLNRQFEEGVEAKHIAEKLKELLAQVAGEDVSPEDYNNALREARTAAREQITGKPAPSTGAMGAGYAR